MTVIDTPMGNTIMLSSEYTGALTKQAELLPLQMRYYWRMADNGRIVTERHFHWGFGICTSDL